MEQQPRPHRVVIIGAGASCDCGMPLVKDMFSRAFMQRLYERDARTPLFSLDSGSFGPDLIDQEMVRHRLEWQLSICSKYENGPSFEEQLYEARMRGDTKACEELMHHYKLLLNACENSAGSPVIVHEHPMAPGSPAFGADYYFYFGAFLRTLLQQGPTTIISFNHDIMVEHGLKWKSFNYGELDRICSPPPLPGQDKRKAPLAAHSPEYGPESITFLKLHGSLNFVVCPQCDKVFVGNNNIWAMQPMLCPVCAVEVVPLYVPPLRSKDTTPLQMLWDEARRALSTAYDIFVFGYSCPPYDHNAISMFKECIPASAAIEIIDPFADAVAPRFSDIACERKGGIKISFREYLRRFFAEELETLLPLMFQF